MNCFWRSRWAGLAGVTVLALCWTGAAAAQSVPVPKSTPLPITHYYPELKNSPLDAYPFLEASRSNEPYDLKKSGYVEEEFLIGGTANVYDWAPDGTLGVKTPNAPYVTRIRVRRPIDPARFSGSVVVEIPNTARRFDWDMMWGYLSDEIIARGDAWVGVTTPGAVSGMKLFNPDRYASVSFANPAPGGCPNAVDFEDGLKWDMLSQVGAALKSNAPGQPLAGFKAQYLYMTTQGADVVTYANAIHSHAKLADGRPVYDGYIFKQPAGAGRINQCAPAPPRGDARNLIKNIGVPVMSVVAQGEVMGTLQTRRADSDDKGDQYRLYEVAGGSHLDKWPYFGFPSLADATAGGNPQGTKEFPFAARCEPEIELVDHPLMAFIYHSTLAHLDDWVKKGTPPPHADRMEIKNGGTPQAALATDQYGVGAGGIRSFWVDAPIATYYTTSPGPGFCPELGHTVYLDWPRLEAKYGSYKDYASKVSPLIDRSVKDGWFTEADAKKIKAEVMAPVTARPAASANQ